MKELRESPARPLPNAMTPALRYARLDFRSPLARPLLPRA
jgi:hypothetical protein